MAEITITGNPKHVYHIVKENRIRIKRGYVSITGDIDKPEVKKQAVKHEIITPKQRKKKYKTKEEKKTPDNK